MSKSKSQVASRAAKDAPITVSQAQLRQARLEQQYRQISKDDNASTTGRLVNPPAAVIANPTGAGGQAGGQGQFGSGAPLSPSVMGAVAGGSFNIRTGPTNQRVTLPSGQMVSVPANSAVRSPTSGGDFMTPTGVGNNSGYAPAGMTAVGFTNQTANLTGKGGNVNPMLARNVFAGVQAGAGAVARANVPNFIPSGTYLPNVPVNLSFGQTQQQPRAIINQPGFNGASVPFMPIVAGQPQPVIYPQRPAPQAPQPQNNTGTAGYWANYNQQQGQKPYVNPAVANTGTAGYWAGYNQQQDQQQDQQQGQQQAASIRPTASYSEANAQQWKDYWNWSAANPQASRAQITADAIAKGQPDPFAPVVMTREQIWEMKAAQRRRQMAKGDVQPATYGYSDFTQNPVPYTGSGVTGDYYSTILNTGSG